MEGKKIKWQASDGMSRYGAAGPPIQHSLKITIPEIAQLLKEEGISPHKIFSKEDFLNDEKLMEAVKDKIDLEDFRAGEKKLKEEKEEENSMIPGSDPKPLTPEQKRQQKIDNEFVPDGELGKGDNDLIPD